MRTVKPLRCPKSCVPALLCSALLGACAAPPGQPPRPTYSVAGAAPALPRGEAERAHAELATQLPARPDLDTLPKVIRSTFPDYPQAWINAGIVGTVTVRFHVEADGTVSDPQVIGSPPKELAAITLHAILQWRFEPATRNATPVRARLEQTFVFQAR